MPDMGEIIALAFALLCIPPALAAVDCSTGSKTCDLCMAKGPPCVWCFDPNYDDRNQGPEFRCGSLPALLQRGCATNSTLSLASEFTVARNESPIETPNKTVQLYPQLVDLKLRPNQPLTLDIAYQQALNYPVDLYYLTDLSYSMNKSLKAVSRQAHIIANTMRNLTTNFRMGFGAFVDKPMYPFMDPRPVMVRNPCHDVKKKKQVQCDPTYGYRHILSLTTNITKFQKVTDSTKPSGNLDGPEGGLDALTQASLCDSVVGWDSKARKIVLFATDAGFHLAGDGRFAGVIKRFQEQCNMSPESAGTSIYNMSTKLDYPSVGQVSRVLESKGIAVIFAVSKSLERLYQNLANILPSAVVGILQGDISKLVRDNYAQISSSIGLTARSDNTDVKVKIVPICPNTTQNSSASGDDPRVGILCENLPLGGRVTFKIEVSTSKCLDKPVNITLSPTNLESEKVVLQVQTACDCRGKCGQTIANAPQCNKGHGNFTCGSCTCNADRSGDFCECSKTPGASLADKCKNPGEENKVCSNRGRCKCGSCRCFSAQYSGALCECDLKACPRASDDGSVCGGPTRGSCSCNETCICREGYVGAACDCLVDKRLCYGNGTSESKVSNSTWLTTARPSDNDTADTAEMCSGRGTCDCGYCVCEAEWTGLTCSERQGGAGQLCSRPSLQQCVLCLLSKHLDESDVYDTDCVCEAAEVDEKLVTFVDEYDTDDGSSLCIVEDKSDCRVYYTYRYEAKIRTTRRLVLSIQRTRQCPDRTSILLIVFLVIFFIVLLGIILLVLWKVFITIHDRRAEAATLKVEDQALFEAGENPIYQPPITTVRNPLCEEPKAS